MNIEDTQDKIQRILEASAHQKWPFPKTFEALKDAGVEYYCVTLSPYERVDFGGEFSWTTIVPSVEIPSLKINSLFSAEKLKEALQHHQKEKTSYLAFLQAAAEAGVHHYRVDMAARTVTYYGVETKNYHTEFVPQIS